MPINLSGSLVLTGSLTSTLGFTGPLSGTASYSSNADMLDGLDSTVFTQTGSFNTFSSSILTYTGSTNSRLNSLESNTGSYATTGSNIFIGTQTISGSIFGSGSLTINGCITSTGQIVAQTINVQQVTSSIVYSCGSNIFGTSISNTQQLTGSVGITGSLTIAGASSATSYNGATIFGSTIACSPIGCFATSCATSFIGGTMSGTTIYGSTAVCSAIGKFTTCIDAGIGKFSGQLDSITGVFGSKGGGTYGILISDNDQSNVRLKFTNIGSGGRSYSIVGGLAGANNSSFSIYDETASATRFDISSTGAATFSSSVKSSTFLSGITSGNSWATVAPSIETLNNSIAYYNDSALPILYLNSNIYYNAGWRYISATANYGVSIEIGGYTSTDAFAVKGTVATGVTGGGATLSTYFKVANSTGAATFNSSVTINKQNEGLILTSGTCTDASYLSTRSNNGTGWLIIGAQGTTSGYIQSGTGANESAITTVGCYALTFGANQVERMRITSGGNIGINTSTPSSFGNYTNVTIKGGSSGANLDFFNSAGTRLANFVLNGSVSAYVGTVTDIPFDITQNDTTRIRVASCGNVGIGTTSPSSILHIVDTSANNTTLTIGEAGEVPTIKAGGANTDLKIEAVGAGGYLQLVTNSNPRIHISPAGNVGIDSTGPYAKLHIGTAANNENNIFFTRNTTTACVIIGGLRSSLGPYWGDATSTSLSEINLETDSPYYKGAISFRTNNSDATANRAVERMRITSAGYVGIGTTTPCSALDVRGTITNGSIAGSDSTLDVSPAKQSIANGGYVDFPSMSGMIVVNDWTDGSVTIFLAGGGSTCAVGSVTGTAGTLHYNGGVAGYRWCNNKGYTANFGFLVFKTRVTA